EHFGRVARNGGVEFFAADIDRGGLRVQDRQGLHHNQRSWVRELASHQVPGRLQKDKPPQREHPTQGVTKQNVCRRPEPISPAGNPGLRDAPKGNAATLRLTADEPLSIRFRGSKRELFFRGNLSPMNKRSGALSTQTPP